MNIYHVRNLDEDYDNNPFYFANSVEEAFEKAADDSEVNEYINADFREYGDISITELDIETKEVRYWQWKWNSDEPRWEIEATNPID